MNQEIEYAEMLEIPVSTVNVVRKKRRKKQENPVNAAPQTAPVIASATPAPLTQQAEPDLPNQPLKDTVIAQINERVEEVKENPPAQINEQSFASAEDIQTEGALRLDPVPERIDTVRLYAEDEMRDFRRNNLNENETETQSESKNGHTRYALNKENQPKAVRLALGIEFAAACVLCGAIFFTNVFMPNSAINTFFRGVTRGGQTETAVNRIYSDFELAPIVSDLSNVTLNLSQAGVLSFTDECCIYPAADGEVADITQNADGGYTMKIQYSNTFTGVFNGLNQVFYEVGDKVKSNVPVAFSDGETEVQVTMYSSGKLLNCFRLTEENCIAWIDEE